MNESQLRETGLRMSAGVAAAVVLTEAALSVRLWREPAVPGV